MSKSKRPSLICVLAFTDKPHRLEKTFLNLKSIVGLDVGPSPHTCTLILKGGRLTIKQNYDIFKNYLQFKGLVLRPVQTNLLI